MLEMLVAANAAFAIIKKTLENGREISSAGSAIANFVGALESIRVKQEKLREYMQLFGRANLYTDYIQFCADCRVSRKEARVKAQKRREYIRDMFLKIVLGILITALLTGVITVLFVLAKKKGLI